MSAKRPTRKQVARAAEVLGLPLDDGDLDEFTEMIGATVETYFRPLDKIADNPPEIRYPRVPGYRPGRTRSPPGIARRRSRVRPGANSRVGRSSSRTISVSPGCR